MSKNELPEEDMPSKRKFFLRYDARFLKRVFAERSEWHPFPPASDREAWKGMLSAPANSRRREYLMRQVRESPGKPWPSLPASLYMDFARTGIRKNYEEPYFARRLRLSDLIIAECMDYRGEFLDEIVNGMSCIMEESTWCLPAHAHRLEDDSLPDFHQYQVDLFACETAMILAEGLYLLNDALEALSPSFCERLREEITARVISPVEKSSDFWWLKGRSNWTPWCASNVLGAAFYVLDDRKRLAPLTLKLMRAVERFIDNYGDDGGCDEGSSYWGVAAGAMLIFLELLYSRSGGKINICDEPRIRNMGRYISNAHIAGRWFVNFADGPAVPDIRRAVVYRYGEKCGDRSLQNIALLSSRNWDSSNQASDKLYGNLTHMIRELFWVPPEVEPEELKHDMTVWMPSIQVMVSREKSDDGKGFVLAVKGGSNNENHNHNDTGQFIIFLAGTPCVIDIGVETYSAKTFSRSRYDIWCIRSAGHNVPQINGFEQSAGPEFCARGVNHESSGDKDSLTMDIAGAYPAQAGIQEYVRSAFLVRGKNPHIVIRDSFKMKQGVPSIIIPVFSKNEVTPVEPGRILIETGPRPVVLEYSQEKLTARVEVVPIEDAQLRKAWGLQLHKIKFRYTGDKAEDSFSMTFHS